MIVSPTRRLCLPVKKSVLVPVTVVEFALIETVPSIYGFKCLPANGNCLTVGNPFTTSLNWPNTGIIASFLWKNTSIFVINSPPIVSSVNVCASGSLLSSSGVKSARTLCLTAVTFDSVLFWVTLVTSILPFLVAIISSCTVLKIPVDENNACAKVSGSGTVSLVAEDVTLKSLSPVLNFGLPVTFGSGNSNSPSILPLPSVNVLVAPFTFCWCPVTPLDDVMVTKLVIFCLSKNG